MRRLTLPRRIALRAGTGIRVNRTVPVISGRGGTICGAVPDGMWTASFIFLRQGLCPSIGIVNTHSWGGPATIRLTTCEAGKHIRLRMEYTVPLIGRLYVCVPTGRCDHGSCCEPRRTPTCAGALDKGGDCKPDAR